jgi:plasmid stability protein
MIEGMLMVDDSKTIRLNLTADEWRMLRIRAAEQGVSMAVYATEVLRADLKRKPARKPAPR